MGTRSRYDGRIQNLYDDEYHAAFQSGVWSNCPIREIRSDPSLGIIVEEHFDNWWGATPSSTTMAGYTASNATSGSVSITSAAHGICALNAAAVTAARGVQIQKIIPTFMCAVDKPLWFECKFRVNALAAEMFAGLALLDTTIISGSGNSSTDHIGWQCVTDDGVMLFSAEKAGTGDTEASTTLVANTDIRLGFRVLNASSSTLKIEHWVNDTKQSTTHTNANVSVLMLSPSFVCQAGGTGTPVMRLDYYRAVQVIA